MTQTLQNARKGGFIIASALVLVSLVVPAFAFAHGGPDGSITVCKMITSDAGVIATDATVLPTGTFSVTLSSGPNAQSLTTLQTFTFDVSQFSPNTKIISSTVNDAECETIDELSNGGYFYNEEIVSGSSDWTSKKYNDQYTGSINSLSDFYSYSGELWDNNPGNDGVRNTDADGHIVLNDGNPERVLVILNTYTTPTTPIPTAYCPFSPATDRTIVYFDGGKIRSDQSLANSMKSESVSLSAGTYDI
ncbi:MAG: hypothetical protein AAB587_01040, partial [Patescibacteria group bacterium]